MQQECMFWVQSRFRREANLIRSPICSPGAERLEIFPIACGQDSHTQSAWVIMLALSIATAGFAQPMLQRSAVTVRASTSMAVVADLAPTGYEWGEAFAFDADGVVVALGKAASASAGSLKQQGIAAIEARNMAQQGLKIATLKREGKAAVEARQQTLRDLKVAVLKQQGLKAIEARNMAQQGLKIATLMREGRAAVEARRQTQQGLKIASLKREGRATVQAREQTQKIATLKREGRATVEAREQTQRALQSK